MIAQALVETNLAKNTHENTEALLLLQHFLLPKLSPYILLKIFERLAEVILKLFQALKDSVNSQKMCIVVIVDLIANIPLQVKLFSCFLFNRD